MIDNELRRVTHVSSDARDTATREQAQHDGENATFTTDPDTAITTCSNLYHEDADFIREETPAPLGSTGGFDNPRQINDLFDDPRILHT